MIFLKSFDALKQCRFESFKVIMQKLLKFQIAIEEVLNFTDFDSKTDEMQNLIVNSESAVSATLIDSRSSKEKHEHN